MLHAKNVLYKCLAIIPNSDSASAGLYMNDTEKDNNHSASLSREIIINGSNIATRHIPAIIPSSRSGLRLSSTHCLLGFSTQIVYTQPSPCTNTGLIYCYFFWRKSNSTVIFNSGIVIGWIGWMNLSVRSTNRHTQARRFFIYAAASALWIYETLELFNQVGEFQIECNSNTGNLLFCKHQ